jgi:ubiquitin-conjugating enzyme E2 variant
MFASSSEDVVVPRAFKLLKELEKGEKGGAGLPPYLSYGLADADEDEDMRAWTGTILGPAGTTLDMRVLELAIECGSAYPERPPEMRFKTKVNLPFVKGDGTVDLKTLGVAQAWKRNNSIEDALNAVYHAMMRPECRRAPQPAEGTRY